MAEALASLAAHGLDLDTSDRGLTEYSYDASNYRIRPLAVVFPRAVSDVVTVIDICRETKTPVIARGGGTSMAGNALGAGVVLDFSRHMQRIDHLDPDPQQPRVSVEAGVILSHLSRAVEEDTDGRYTFAPDPSSKNRATIGGALGNDACGNHSVRYGRTEDHVLEIDLVTSSGTQLTATATGIWATHANDAPAIAHAERLSNELARLAAENLAPFRVELGTISRQVSGYHLKNLLPEQGFNLARALVGSEGSCAIIVGATMRLVTKPAHTLLLCLGYPEVVSAATDVETILEFSPTAVEGIDNGIVETMRARRGHDTVGALPAGSAWLYVELTAETPQHLQHKAQELLKRLEANGQLLESRLVTTDSERASLWRVREDGAGLSSRLIPTSASSEIESWPGWEDSAVAPEHLAAYLQDLLKLLAEYRLTAVMYGHFGAGCVHVRIDYDFRTASGRKVFRDFTTAAAKLVVSYGGSLSGEHGDGRARSELLPFMYSPQMLAAFQDFKRLWDPDNLLNPGNITNADPLDKHLSLNITPTGNPWAQELQRCIGVARCRTDSGGVMCPSYRATQAEKDSTRGRARVLQDMLRGANNRTLYGSDPAAIESAREALDLCLSCKACSSDCPTGVDMARYKSEFLAQYYQGRRRPISHYSLGWLPRWLKLSRRITPLVNLLLSTPLAKLLSIAGGISPERSLPQFANARQWRQELATAGVSLETGTGGADAQVLLFIDTFTRSFRPKVAGAAARVLHATGAAVACTAEACCGLTWISTGQLDTARKILAKTAALLDDGTERPIIVPEPSCAATLRKDLPELLPGDQAQRVSQRIHSFASYLSPHIKAGWRPPASSSDRPGAAKALPEQVVVQTHCHEYSTFGSQVQQDLLQHLGIPSVLAATGCCGVAGNFGFEKEHFQLSMRVAKQALIPTLEESEAEAVILSDGFSCAMQIQQIDPSRQGQHLAQLLDPGHPLPSESPSPTYDPQVKEIS